MVLKGRVYPHATVRSIHQKEYAYMFNMENGNYCIPPLATEDNCNCPAKADCMQRSTEA